MYIFRLSVNAESVSELYMFLLLNTYTVLFTFMLHTLLQIYNAILNFVKEDIWLLFLYCVLIPCLLASYTQYCYVENIQTVDAIMLACLLLETETCITNTPIELSLYMHR